MNKPSLIVFCSGNAIPVGEAVKANLERHFVADIWTQGFFDEPNTLPLNTFLKKLFKYDIAVLILANDDTQLDREGGKIHVPRDNVIFELGATMARMGTRKTFIICPKDPQVKLPSYFSGLEPLTYEPRMDNLRSATGTACSQIRTSIEKLEEYAYHSDLPAVGLAFGYFFNFVLAVQQNKEAQNLELDSNQSWSPEMGSSLKIVIPTQLMTREAIDKFLADRGAKNIHVRLKNGRDISAYVLPRKRPASPLNIIDIPTTLLTSEKIIRELDSFWGGGDREFKQALASRELTSFARRLRSLIHEHQATSVEVISVEDADETISRLKDI